MQYEDAMALVEVYENTRRDADQVRKLYEERRELVLAYVKDELDALAAEMEPYLNISELSAREAEEAARKAVMSIGETVDGATVQFIYVKGKTTWDGQMLQGMAKIIPELESAKKTGEPGVSIRRKK